MNFLKRFVIVFVIMGLLAVAHGYMFGEGFNSLPKGMMITGGLGLGLSFVRHMPRMGAAGSNPMNRSVHTMVSTNMEEGVKISSGFSKALNMIGLVGFLFLVVGFYLISV